jgi:2,3-dihydroxy-2,3-dihydro-p-cumate dehydrogenase
MPRDEVRLLSEERFPVLQGKKAIVTGAGQGIGREIALVLALHGADVMLADLSEEKVREACGAIAERTNRRTTIFTGDLSEEETSRRMIRKAIDEFGHVDILVNNAGGGIIQPFLEHTPETLRATISRNLWTTVWACYFVLPHMKERTYGRIVNIGADSVRLPIWGMAAYNAAKGGVHGLTGALAREFAQWDITVNAVAPCLVETEHVSEALRGRTLPHPLNLYAAAIPKGRPAKMEEIADAVVFLCSDRASFITGQVLYVNGGTTLL